MSLFIFGVLWVFVANDTHAHNLFAAKKRKSSEKKNDWREENVFWFPRNNHWDISLTDDNHLQSTNTQHTIKMNISQMCTNHVRPTHFNVQVILLYSFFLALVSLRTAFVSPIQKMKCKYFSDEKWIKNKDNPNEFVGKHLS